MNQKQKTKTSGFGIIEIIIAMSIMILMATSVVGVVIYGFTVNRLGVEGTIAHMFSQEGIEAVRSIRNRNWTDVTTGTHGLTTSGNLWSFSGTSNTQDKFTRQITISSVERSGGGNGDIVTGGGTVDTDTMLATSTATWNSSPTRSNNVTLTAYFTNWRKSICNWTSASLKGSYDKVGNIDPTDVIMDGNYALLATKDQTGIDPEFFIIDTTNVAIPALTGSLEIGADVNGVFLSGNYAYLATSGNLTELVIVDISNKSLPTIAGVGLNIGGNQDATDIYVSGNYAYITKASGGGANRELYIIDVSNPLLPSQVGSYEVGADANAVFVSGNYAYLATGDNAAELTVVDVTNKAAPTLAGTFNASGNDDGRSIFLVSSTAYLGRDSGANPDFLILNVSSLGSISQTGSYEVGGTVYEVQVNASDAFLATDVGGGQFRVVDISTPSLPTLKTSLSLGGTALGLAFDANRCTAYVANGSNTQELQVIQP